MPDAEPTVVFYEADFRPVIDEIRRQIGDGRGFGVVRDREWAAFGRPYLERAPISERILLTGRSCRLARSPKSKLEPVVRL